MSAVGICLTGILNSTLRAQPPKPISEQARATLREDPRRCRRKVPGMLAGVLGAPKQLQGSKQVNGVNVNALVSQREADMGHGPVFFSTLAEIEKVAAAPDR